MARDHSLVSRPFRGTGGRRNTSRGARSLATIESLEDRRLLSATVVNPGGPVLVSPTPTPVAAAARGYGVTLNLKAGQIFNGYLGDLVNAKVPAGFVISAGITWGDGSADSQGKITIGSTGNIDVSGSHTYAKAGKYAISIGVTAAPAPSKTGASAPIILFLGTIRSTAVVSAASLNLNGTIKGKFIPAPTAASVGALYIFDNATGTAGALGTVSASGRIQLPPLMTTGPVSGSMTLTAISASTAGPSGSVTLALTGPIEASSGPIPAVLNYVITGGTGSFANATGTGTINLTLSSTGLTFNMMIHSN